MATSTNNSRSATNQKGSGAVPKDQGKYSLYLNIGWTFSNSSKNKPSGQYVLKLGQQTVKDEFTDGMIKIVNGIKALKDSGELTMMLTEGPTYKADVKLGGLPNVATPDGLARRLTNLGFYAGPDTNGKCNARMAWAIRAFKRVKMNNYVRNRPEVENNEVTGKFLKAVQDAYGAHSNDSFANKGKKEFPAANEAVPYCGMFGEHLYYRGSFETRGQADDVDPGPGQTGIWEGKSAAPEAGKPRPKPEPIAGKYTLYLRAYDPNEKKEDPKTKRKINVQPFWNRINLPQPIHMAQFVLFELGYWLVGGETQDTDWVAVENTRTRNRFTPNGKFERYTQWAVREFQCHAKFPNAAKEDVSSKDLRYMLRVFKGTKNEPPKLSGDACYSKDGKVSGALNEATRKALQAWADGSLRCPVIVYSSTDNHNKTSGNGSNPDLILRENLWLYNDHPNTAPRMYAIDYSGYYTIPNAYSGQVSTGGYTFPKPIVVGAYTNALFGGCISLPQYHSWKSVYAEVRPDTMIGKGGDNGADLGEEELSTFKVIRTACHFECYGYFDCLNAYDCVTLSFGPCHWTLQDCDGKYPADTAREMPAFLAYMKKNYTNDYNEYFGIFGFEPKTDWSKISKGGLGTYNDKMTIQTENEDNIVLYGKVTDGHGENKYLKNWHSYYRFLMSTRLSTDLRRAMWDFTRIRIRDIIEREFRIQVKKGEKIETELVRVGTYVTSEKGVAMLLRWHIIAPNVYAREGPLHKTLREVILSGKYSGENQLRENEILLQLSNKGGPPTSGQVTEIYNYKRIPQKGKRAYYALNISQVDAILSSEYGSFKLDKTGLPELNQK
jgi:hypothetical protein